MIKFYENKTYPVYENMDGNLIVGEPSTSYLSGETLNKLQDRGAGCIDHRTESGRISIPCLSGIFTIVLAVSWILSGIF